MVKKRRRGRPKKPNANRTPSGQISRSTPPKDIMDVALAYRKQHYDLPDGLNTEQQRAAATNLGRLWLSHQITEPMWKAGEKYLAAYEDMQRAIKAPVGLRKTNAAGTGGDMETLEYVEWAIAAVARWEAFQLRGWPVLRAVVLEDMPASDTMLAELRVALNILAKRFGVEAYIAAAS